MLRRGKKNNNESITRQLNEVIRSINAIKLENEKSRIDNEIIHQKQMLHVYRANSQNMTVSYLSYMEAGINDVIMGLQKELKDVEELKKRTHELLSFLRNT